MPDGTGTPQLFSTPQPHVLAASTRLLPTIVALKPLKAPWILHNVSSDRLFSVLYNASSAANVSCCNPLLFPTVTSTISDSDFGSSASNFRGPTSTYNTHPSSYPRQFQGSYAAPSTVMSQPYYSSYAPSGATTYSSYSSGAGAYQTGSATQRTYFSLNGKLVRSSKVRSYRVCLFHHSHYLDNHLIDLIFFFSRSEPKNMSSIYFPTCCKASPLPASNSL